MMIITCPYCSGTYEYDNDVIDFDKPIIGSVTNLAECDGCKRHFIVKIDIEKTFDLNQKID